MRAMMNHRTVRLGATAAILGLAMISLASCSSSGDETTSQVTSSSSAGLQGPIVFVNNTGDKTLTSVALRGDSGNAVLDTIPSSEFENVSLGDMQFSAGDWVFVNITGETSPGVRLSKVATIDPINGAVPIHRVNLETGTRPVHIYRDTTNGEIIWSMNDGENAAGPTLGDDLINCNNLARVGGPVLGGSVTILHNSHLGPGASPPTVEGTVCILADGHKVSAFSSGTGVPKRVFVSSTTAGEIAVIDNEPASGTYQKLIGRIDLCTDAGEALPPSQPICDVNANAANTPNTPNKSNPHGIRFSKLTGKVYSIQEGYRTIVEVDPITMTVTPNTFDLSATPYTAFGITPNGRFLLLRGNTTPIATGTKLGVIDLAAPGSPPIDIPISELDGTSAGSFKFSPDGKRFYILAGNAVTSGKKDRLFVFDASALPALTLIKEIQLIAGGDSVGFNAAHNIDVLVQGAGEAKYIAVSNRGGNSVSIINATDNVIKQTVPVGTSPGAVLVYSSGAATVGNQATASVTSSGAAASLPLPERLDDHGMPE